MHGRGGTWALRGEGSEWRRSYGRGGLWVRSHIRYRRHYYTLSAPRGRRRYHQPSDNSWWPLYKVTNDHSGPWPQSPQPGYLSSTPSCLPAVDSTFIYRTTSPPTSPPASPSALSPAVSHAIGSTHCPYLATRNHHLLVAVFTLFDIGISMENAVMKRHTKLM